MRRSRGSGISPWLSVVGGPVVWQAPEDGMLSNHVSFLLDKDTCTHFSADNFDFSVWYYVTRLICIEEFCLFLDLLHNITYFTLYYAM